MKVLVTGGAGFIGSHIVDLLLTQGYDVTIVDNLTTGDRKFLSANASFYEASVEDRDQMASIFTMERPDYVIHQAAQIKVPVSVKNPVHDCKVNVLGTLTLLELARAYDVRKFVYPGSAACYGQPQWLPLTEDHPVGPISPYGISKLTAELYTSVYHQLYGMPTTVLRYANVYGPRQGEQGEGSVISIFINHLLNGTTPIIEGDGSATRDYIYVEDIARANVAALTAGDGQTINISTNVEVSVLEVLSLLCELYGVPVKAEHGPPRIGDIHRSVMSNERATKHLGWQPEVSLRDGLSRTLNWAVAANR